MKHFSLVLIATALACSAKAGNITRPLPIKTTTDTSASRPAPDFKLKDLDGKVVSLKDFKGKILVLDFWATWCSPCRESFPAMKVLVEKYKNDPKVKFLFVDTREKIEDYKEQVKKYLTDNNYPFNVVFDEKSESGKMDVVYKQYNMPGIPTKYIIDGNGIIRHTSVGFMPGKTVEETVKEFEAELAKLK